MRQMEDVILDEINVKAIEYVTDESGIVKKRAKPNFKSIGPKFGKTAQQVAGRIKELDRDGDASWSATAVWRLPVERFRPVPLARKTSRSCGRTFRDGSWSPTEASRWHWTRS